MNTPGTNNHAAKNGTWLPRRIRQAKKPNGAFIGEAAPARDSQWRRRITDSIPETNFGMREDKTDELVSSAHAVAATGKTIEDVRRRGTDMFEATWGDVRVQSETKRANAIRKKECAGAERMLLDTALGTINPTMSLRDGKLTAPTGWAFPLVLATGAGLVTLLGCEWIGAATLRKFELQSLPIALLLTSPFIAFALATKLLFRPNPSRATRLLQWVFHTVGIAAALTWLVLFATNYGTALREDYSVPTKTATIVFTVAQFMAAIAGSCWLTILLSSLFAPVPAVKLDPNWARVASERRRLDDEINRWATAIGDEDAKIAAYNASRDAWIAIGEDTYHRSRQRLALIEERIRLIDTP